MVSPLFQKAGLAMKNQSKRIIILMLLAVAVCQGGVVTYWNGGSTVDKTNWLDAQNWTNGVPSKYDHAIIHTATVFPAINTDVGQVHWLSPSWHNVTTTLTMNNGGRLHALGLLTLGHDTGGSSRLTMNGGYLNASWLRVGENGNGRINLYGGQIDADKLEFGQDIGTGIGYIDLKGGRLTLMDNKMTEVAGYVAASRIVAYSYNGRVYYDFHQTTPGRTTVMAIDSKIKAWKPFPSDKKEMSQNPAPMTLTWLAGDTAAQHDVYFGTSYTTVNSASVSDTSGVYRSRRLLTNYTVPESLSGQQTYYWRIDEVASGGSVTKGDVWSFTTAPVREAMDLFSDTWVAVDDLGREMVGFDRCGPVRQDRTVGLYYCVWHKRHPVIGPHNNTEIIAANPANPAFLCGPGEALFWWAEPQAGYYLPDDRWQIRRNLSMLTDAGVDVLILEATNATAYIYESLVVCDVLAQMKSEGLLTDMKVCFWTHAQSPATVKQYYDNIYALNLYPELWFNWQGKPLMLGYPDGITGDNPVESVSAEIRNFFTWRKCWFDVSGDMYHEWQWADVSPQGFGYDGSSDIAEQVPISPATHPTSNMGKSYQYLAGGQPALNELDLPVTGTEGHGLFFEDQSQRALQLDPRFMFITSWNEWIMGWYLKEPGIYDGLELLGRPVADGDYYTVDSYNAEYNRDLEPMKGGWGDNYYYHMINTIRRFKGARPPQMPSGQKTITIDGEFSDWQDVRPVFYDTSGDTSHRNWPGVAFTGQYINTTGRNDILSTKVSRDEQYVYFYVQTRDDLTSHTNSNWMMLFINADQNYTTGWQGYDYVINQTITSSSLTTLKHTSAGWNWSAVSDSIAYHYMGNQMEIAVPRSLLNLPPGTDELSIDFHWADTAAIMPKYKHGYPFTVAGSLQGWGAINNVSDMTASSGILSFNVVGTDPFIYSPPNNMYAATYNYIKIRMRNHTAADSAQIYWITLGDMVFNEAKSMVFPITPTDSLFREYIVDLSQHPEWKGVVRQLRFDPGGGSLGLFEVDFIEIYPHPESLDFGLDGDQAPNRRFNYRYDTSLSEKACELLWLDGGGESGDLDRNCRVDWSDLMVLAERWIVEYDMLSFASVAEQWLTEQSPTGLHKVLFQDDFESGLGNWSTDWTTSNINYYSANTSAECTSVDNDLVSPALDLTPFESVLVTFRYRLNGVDADDNLKIYYHNGSTYQEVGDISNHQGNIWLYYTHTLRKTGPDAAYFHGAFRFKIAGAGLDSGEEACVDDVKVIGIK